MREVNIYTKTGEIFARKMANHKAQKFAFDIITSKYKDVIKVRVEKPKKEDLV